MLTWKGNEREAKQLKLLLHLHSQVCMCQTWPPALTSLQKLLHEWLELQVSLCHWKPEFWRNLLRHAGIKFPLICETFEQVMTINVTANCACRAL